MEQALLVVTTLAAVGAAAWALTLRSRLRKAASEDPSGDPGSLTELNRALLEMAKRQAISEQGVQASLREITETAARSLGVARVGVWLQTDEEPPAIRCIHQFDADEEAPRQAGGAISRRDAPAYFDALQDSRWLAAHDARTDPRTRELRWYLEKHGIDALLDAPVRIGGELRGVVCHEHRGGPREWGALETQFAASVGDLVSVVLEAGEHRRTAAELAEARSKTLQILDTVTDAFFHLDPDLRFTYVNPRAGELVRNLGEDPDRLVGRSIWNVFDVPPDDVNRRHLEEALATREAVHLHRHVPALGRWLEIHGYPSADGVAVYVRDVTDRRAAEEALRESEERFRTVVESLGEGLVLTDLESRITYMNPRMAELTGYTLEEVEGRSTVDVFVPEHRRDDVRTRLNTRRHGVSERYELPIERKDGNRIWTEIQGSPLQNAHGEIVGIVGAVTDVTERKEAEEALRESEERFRHMVQRAPEAIVVMDPEGPEILTVNDNMVELFGMPREELMKTFPPELSPPLQPDGRPSAQAADEYIRKALEGEDQVFEWVHLRGDGSEVLCEIRLTRLPMGDRNVIRASLTDITERKEAEKALRESEERYRTLFESDVAGNYVIGADGIIRNCNAAFARIFGFDSPDDAIGTQVVPRLESPETRDAFLDEVREHGSLRLRETEGRRLDGSTVYVTENVRGVFDDDGELVEVRGHVIDVTERRELEEQLRHAQKMEAVGQLAGGIAHDFNNLLTAVGGHAELLLLDENTPEAIKDDVRKIREAAGRATNLTDQLLAFSRRQVLQSRILDLSEVVAGVRHIMERLLGEDIELRFDLGPVDPVRTDPNQVEQTLLNLAVNARDAMPDGGRIEVRTRNVTLGRDAASRLVDLEPGRYVLLEFSDTGEGMPEEIREKIFEPFFTTKDPGKGTGLGLAMVYGFVHQTDGHLEVESEVGRGTRFLIYLPCVEEEVKVRTEGAPAAGDGAGSETVLLVDDEDAVRALARKILERKGYTVLEADHPGKALIHAEQWPERLDLLLTDIVMPKMDGQTLARKVLEHRPEIGILYITGHTDLELEPGGPAGSEGRLLTKPFTPETLVERVRNALDARVGAVAGTAKSP